MKKLLLSGLFCLILTLAVQAQRYSPEVRTIANTLVEQYHLEGEQVEKAYVIAERQLRNLAEIETLRNSDYELYLRKRRSIRLGTQSSIERMLTNDRQREALAAVRLAQRQKESDTIKKLRAEGASKVEIQRAMLLAEDQD